MKKLDVLSLFSGCGGLDLGFQSGFTFCGNVFKENSFNIVWVNDIDKNACLTYSKNFKYNIICGDTGVFQDSWHSLADFYAASFIGLSGFNVTAPIALQS